jgi:hypothetical protein
MKQSTSSSDRKNRQLKCYVTTVAFDRLKMEFDDSGFRSWSAYLRRRLSGKGTIIQRPKEVLEALDRIGAEINRIGNNINQMTKLAHLMEKEGRLSELTIRRFAEDLINYHQVLKELSLAYNNLLTRFDD